MSEEKLQREIIDLKKALHILKGREQHYQNRFKTFEKTITELKLAASNNGNDNLVKLLEERNETIEQLNKNDDMKRVLEKLQKTQQDCSNLKEQLLDTERGKERMMQQNSELNQLLNDLRKKLEMTSKQTSNKVDQNIQDKVVELSEAYSSVLNENNIIKVKLEKSEKSLDQKTDELKELAEKHHLMSYEVSDLKQQKEKLEIKCEKELERCQMEFQSEITKLKTDWDDRNDRINRDIDLKKKEYDNLKELYDNVKIEHEKIMNINSKLQKENEKLEKQLQEQQSKLTECEHTLDEMKLERGIESKKRNQLVKQLRNELKNKSSEVEANHIEMSRLNGIITSLQNDLNEVKNNKDKNDNNDNTNINDDNNVVGIIKRMNSNKSINNDDVEVEVSVALAEKLSKSENENFKLKQKLQFLESNIQSLTDDLDSKRKVIEYYIQRVGPGALTTPEILDDVERKRQASKKYTKEHQKELYDKMELILQETVLENVLLKEAKKELGNELTRLHHEINELKNK